MLNVNDVLPYLVPLIVLQFCMQIYSVINLIRRKKVRFNNKLLWGIIIVIFGLVGSAVYLIFRGDEE